MKEEIEYEENYDMWIGIGIGIGFTLITMAILIYSALRWWL